MVDQTVLPPEWRVVELGEIATVKYGKAKPKEPGDVPAVGSGGVYASTSHALIDYPTLVVGRKGTAGVAWLQEQPCWPSDTTFYLEWITDEIDYRFLYYVLQNRPLSGEHARTTLPSLQKADLETYLLPLPPLHEQRAVVRVLQSAQDAIQARRRELDLERERKAALMQHLFTRGTRGEPIKQTEIGEMPQSWRVVRFGEVVDIAGGQVNPKLEPYASMIHVGPENVEPDTGHLSASRTNSQLGIISGNYCFTEEDIVYSKIRPYLNKAAMPTFQGTCSADMYVLRSESQVLIT